MTTHDFLALSNAGISNNPQDRLPQDIKNILTAVPPTSEKMIFDLHAHCFTATYLPPEDKPFRSASKIPLGSTLLTLVYKLTGFLNKALHGKYFDYYQALARKHSLRQFLLRYKTSDEALVHHFNCYNEAFEEKLFRSRPHIFVSALMVHLENSQADDTGALFYAQWADLCQLRGMRQHNRSLIPFLAVDPRNPNLYVDFLAAFSEPAKRINHTGQAFLDTAFPFFGIYVYPSLGYLPSDPVLMPIYQVCQEKGIPVIAHCGSADTRFSAEKISGTYCDEQGQEVYSFDRTQFGGKAKQATEITHFFNAPSKWIPVVKTFPDLRINLAHLGSNEAWYEYRKGKKHTFIHEALEMMEAYPGVYADISQVFAQKSTLTAIYDLLYHTRFSAKQRDAFRTKLLYGSDNYLTELDTGLVKAIVQLINLFQHDKAMIHQLCIHNARRFLWG